MLIKINIPRRKVFSILISDKFSSILQVLPFSKHRVLASFMEYLLLQTQVFVSIEQSVPFNIHCSLISHLSPK